MAAEAAWQELGNFIRAQRRMARLSLRQLSELSSVSNPYLSQVERGLYRPSAQVLMGIARALHLSAETLYARAGLLDEELDESAELDGEVALRPSPQLSADQKAAEH